MMKKVCVVGLGYIGLPTAGLLASKGFKVHGVDVNESAVETINKGNIHIYEPDLDKLIKKVVESGNLVASTNPEEADIYILAVPTPFKEGRKPDLTYVEEATKAIVPYIQAGNIVILESTSPVGTTEKIANWIMEGRSDLTINGENNIYVAHCPERVLPGHILRELVENDRIVGGINEESSIKTVDFYNTFVTGKVLKTSAKTAELAKLTENSFRDVNIAFANELSMICDKLDINVWELIELANHHPRVNILQPGPGVGGHCIAVDPWFIVDAAPEESKLIYTARNVNDFKPHYVINKVKELAKDEVRTVACLGITFKADIDDLRESPSLDIVSRLAREEKYILNIVEPNIDRLPEVLDVKNANLCDLKNALSNSDIVLVLVDHKDFKQMDQRLLNDKIVIDTKGLLEGIECKDKLLSTI
ncbi:UDP-N-acetyl-D-mannosamine dehydrogenase [Priestia filamentosa]|uniref:UDP-N-acetyl-D-mannosamine dehydrogenase n=1 Tax=Priestia filamentosa TaxID=1402861 RepID=UPI0039827572